MEFEQYSVNSRKINEKLGQFWDGITDSAWIRNGTAVNDLK